MHPLAILQLMILLTLANGTPVIAKKILGRRLDHPLDFGLRLNDGKPLFGASKTIRGVVLAVAATTLVAPLVGLPWKIGALVAVFAMIGDLFSSFLKRRLNLPLHSRALGLDQIPESLFPLLAVASALALTAADIAAGVAVFFAGELILSRLTYRLGLRDRPY